jgi:hypothetical protein
MQFLTRPIVRRVAKVSLFGVATAVLSASATLSPTALAEIHPVITSKNAIVAEQVLFPEVRLRKLHLVRPDLIPYPLYYEVYC